MISEISGGDAVELHANNKMYSPLEKVLREGRLAFKELNSSPEGCHFNRTF